MPDGTGPAEWLYHYHERSVDPFLNLSALEPGHASCILDEIRADGRGFASTRPAGYLERRRELESLIRRMFISRGGRPEVPWPHYFTLGPCPWLMDWYAEPACVRIRLDGIDPTLVSFTYGDMFPTFSERCADGREYRGRIYVLDEIRELIGRIGMPGDWNPSGEYGPERYVEAHLWVAHPEKYIHENIRSEK